MLSYKKSLLKLILDTGAIFLASFLATVIRFEGNWQKYFHLKYFFVYLFFYLVVYFYGKTELKSWRYTNALDILSLIAINIVAFFGMVTYFSFTQEEYSRSVAYMVLDFTVIFQLASRFLLRLNKVYKKSTQKKKMALVYGVGETGSEFIMESVMNSSFPYRLTGIIDDNSEKMGNIFNGVRVLGDFKNLGKILEKNNYLETIIIAISDIDKKRIGEIVHEVRKYRSDIEIKILPRMDEILQGENIWQQIRDVNIEDLLGRNQILVNGDSIREFIRDRVVFVTGGGGSIGSELARQIALYSPKKLVAIDVNENTLYFLELELGRTYPNLDFQSEICNIRESKKLDFLFEKYRPEIVFHAAAHKHVPLMEHNPEEAIKNNIFGTRNITEISEKYGVDKFVLISTDKAVNPTNVMGATKRACEMLVERANKNSKKTGFMAVRFGNVLGSNGSVIPIFRELIAQGKNLTITHPDITRYFMTIPEAAQLVIEAGSLGEGGEVFILDMGEPVRIMNLAKKMIALSGADVGIDIIGLRPGEKLYEELLYDVNSAERTANQKIFVTTLKEDDLEIEPYMEELERAVENPNSENIKEIMKRFIKSYKEPKDCIQKGENR
ncbi:MAG: polysaccharide biosynthesis protein [Fusobacteriaceae bacterium]